MGREFGVFIFMSMFFFEVIRYVIFLIKYVNKVNLVVGYGECVLFVF